MKKSLILFLFNPLWVQCSDNLRNINTRIQELTMWAHSIQHLSDRCELNERNQANELLSALNAEITLQTINRNEEICAEINRTEDHINQITQEIELMKPYVQKWAEPYRSEVDRLGGMFIHTFDPTIETYYRHTALLAQESAHLESLLNQR